MQIKRIKSLLNSQAGEAQIQAMAWSANNQKFAACTADRVVHLFDEHGEKRDKFSTKPCDSKFGKTSYLVNALAFSVDGSMLAVAQTDNIVFVYKIGYDWFVSKIFSYLFILMILKVFFCSFKGVKRNRSLQN